MTKKLNKRGFTIVELVVVIVVIAILAAVLIPTISNLVSKANKNKDTQLVRNLNTALAADVNKHNTMSEALAAAAEFGYDVAKINASEKDNEILWDSVNDVFCYLDENKVTYIPDSVTTAQSGVVLWKIAADSNSLSSTYSNYLADGFTGEVNATTCVDVGNNNGINITYTGSEKGVVIRTNGGTLTVNSAQADVEHYGSSEKVIITEAAMQSYHEHGLVTEMEVTKGHVVIESGAIVNSITKAESGATFTSNGGLVLSVPDGESPASGVKATDEQKGAFSLEISTAAELASFRDSVNAGISYEGLTVKLTADIDLSVYANWNPIGNRYTLDGNTVVDWDKENQNAVRRIFKGTFDGQNHTISGMNINSLSSNYQGLRADNTGDPNKSSYAALFGYVSDATLKNFTVSGSVVGVDVAGVVGITGGVCNIENVISNVDLTGKNGTNEENSVRGKVAGFVCCPKGTSLTIKNCTNNGDVSGSSQTTYHSEPVGGFVGYHSWGSLTLDGCVNNGDILHNNETAGGLVGCIQYGVDGSADVWKQGYSITIKNCKNTGKINGYYAGAAVGCMTRFGEKVEIVGFINNGVINSSNTGTKTDDVGSYNGTVNEEKTEYTKASD